MNPRIRELANQAGYNDQIYEISREGLDKFAELIVKECVGICMKKFDTGLLMAPQAPWIAKQIQEHFGVEE